MQYGGKMNLSEFNNVLDFAIEKEKEAVAFYNELQNKTEFTALKQMLSDLENMEKGHIKVIENIREKGISEAIIKEITPFSYSDNYEEPDNYQNLDFPSILLIAIKREDKSFNLYSAMVERVSDVTLKNLFKQLANEEAQHKLRFEKLYEETILKDN